MWTVGKHVLSPELAGGSGASGPARLALAEELDHNPSAVNVQGIASLAPLFVAHLVFSASYVFVFSHNSNWTSS